MRCNGHEIRPGSSETPRNDGYDYTYFSPQQNPDGELLAKQIQAQSYVAMRIVRPEGLITLANGAQIMAPEVTNPSGSHYQAPPNSRTEYVIGIEKGSTDLNPLTGRLVTWKKYYAPLDELPAYQFGKDKLWPEGEAYLRQVAADPQYTLVEPEGLGKTKRAGGGVVKELIRAEIQRAIGKGEIWFMGLVEATAYESFIHNWGTSAVRQIGDSKLTRHPLMYDGVALVPTIMDIDNFYANMAYDILAPGNKYVEKQLKNFLYMTEGVSDATLGVDLADFRDWARITIGNQGGDA